MPVETGSIPHKAATGRGAKGARPRQFSAIKPRTAVLGALMASVMVVWPALAAGRYPGGLWTKTSHPDPSNLAIVYIDRQAARVIGYGQISGKPALWYAEGTYGEGRMHLVYRYSEDALPAGWERQGSMLLELSEDGNLMTGRATSASGRWSGPIAFQRIGLPVD